MALRLPPPLRRLASLPIRSVPVRVRSSPNAGRRWSLAASGRGIWPGPYEQQRLEALANMVLFSVHSGPQLTACLDVLRPLPYRLLGSSGLHTFMDRLDASWHDDPDVLALPLDGRRDPDAVRGTRWFREGPELSGPTEPPPIHRP